MPRIFQNRYFKCASGVALICLSVAVALGWYFWLVPALQRFDPVWEKRFSRQAYWEETGKRIRRFGWMHDDFAIVGDYGDKSWAEWIMKRARAGEKIGDCGRVGHKAEALKFITGNNPAGTNWAVESFWLKWWDENKDKSQVEWIRAGLQAHGVSVHMPATTNEIIPLLELLGRTNQSDTIPNFVRYNAFRWLRDSDFEPVTFLLGQAANDMPEEMRSGLIRYQRYERVFPKLDGGGLLTHSDSSSRDLNRRPFLFSPANQFIAHVLMIVPFLIGSILLRRSCRAG
ncbi:MAG TPA: hypothetical protein VFW05_05415 [Verrucomicrobiae bacterium]|nr:hypothetical protein [Verrucomicrobiae bacterium]